MKSAPTYCGGSIFVQSADFSGKLAKTVLAMMINSMFYISEFIFKVYAISKLAAQFVCDKATNLLPTIKNELSSKALVFIADGHHANQKRFKLLNPDTHHNPWLIESSS